MLKPVTFKATQNFKANLYALEVRSRFIDPNNANGYYEDYGDDLSATVIGTSGIQIGSGALLIQGRMLEVVLSEVVEIDYQEGKVGYILCRIETSPATNATSCSFVARIGSELSQIAITQEDTYSYASEDENKVYELPIYSFCMRNTEISAVEMLIKPISEMKELQERMEAMKKIWIHHIRFRVSALISSDFVGHILCDIVTQDNVPFSEKSQYFPLQGLFEYLKTHKVTPCYGYFESGKYLPCFIEYDETSTEGILHYMNLESNKKETIGIGIINVTNFTDTVVS